MSIRHILIAGTALALAMTAAAHTSSLGYVPGSAAGSVTIWTGSYDHGGFPGVEGTGTLTGVDVVYSSSQNFSLGVTATKPTGLVDGTNNFFWAEDGRGAYTFPNSVDPIIFGLGIKYWQGVTYTGLTAGT